MIEVTQALTRYLSTTELVEIWLIERRVAEVQHRAEMVLEGGL